MDVRSSVLGIPVEEAYFQTMTILWG